MLSRITHTVRSKSSNIVRGMSTLDLSGIFPPISTPFTEDQSAVNFPKLEENLSKWQAFSFKGYVVQGSNGEVAYMEDDEKIAVLKTVKKFLKTGQLLIAGCGGESTMATIRLAESMSTYADAMLVRNPCFYKGSMTDQALIQHYLSIAENISVPIILYNVPANTGLEISENVIVELSKHHNIIGLKDSGGDITRISSLIYKTSCIDDFQILAGSASFLLPALTMGCVGGVCALANILGKEVCQLEELYRLGNFSEAKKLQLKLVGPNIAVTKRFGIAGLKAAMDMFGFYGGRCRSPIRCLEKDDVVLLKKEFEGFL